jgi:hypothetical protein
MHKYLVFIYLILSDIKYQINKISNADKE